MNLLGVLPFARELLNKVVSEGDIVIDGTAGNGHDTLFLTKLVGKTGKVYSFDIQEEAINATYDRLLKENMEHVATLIHDGHENVLNHLEKEHHHQVAGAIFNLGYFPGGDKGIVTTPDTTISAVEKILLHLRKGGILVLVVYHGHPEGKFEKELLVPYVRKLPQDQYHVLEYRFTNQMNNPPFIIGVEKR
ncbi:class I SAM-dependent methyltransferase [Evansella sp. AB-P1]|uniref:tRNA (mnm(5)s(2)U34)-methyltransferase n=1 Tax=Evansella sp. AB-P1 TaxID=3037653 RepID=UPI00241FEF05|nr:class I SAM-dependent methyltransferase [Evansella sp. AB-P1]MDG5787758.1 class I SAM-dependent methyltransferase [Evansella sp. AB-P1]